MERPSIAFRVMLSPLVFVLGLVVLYRYGLSIVIPQPPSAPARPKVPLSTPTPHGPDPRMVRELIEGPNRAEAARGLRAGGFADAAWLPAIETGLAGATTPYDRLAFQCLRLDTPQAAQLPMSRDVLLRGLGDTQDEGRDEQQCALQALSRMQAEVKAPLVGLVLAFADVHPWSLDAASDALAGLRVEPLPETVLRRLNSTERKERLMGAKLAVSLGAGDFDPDLIRLASAGVWPQLREALIYRRDKGAARFLARMALVHRDDPVTMQALADADALGAASRTFADLALDEQEAEPIRTGAIEFLAFQGRQGVCFRIEPLRRSSSEAIRAYANAALMEPRCRP